MPRTRSVGGADELYALQLDVPGGSSARRAVDAELDHLRKQQGRATGGSPGAAPAKARAKARSKADKAAPVEVERD